MKLTKKAIYILIFSIILLSCAIFLSFFIIAKNKTPNVVFYGLENNIVESIKETFLEEGKNYFTKKNQKVNFLVLDENLPLKSQLKKIKNVVTVFSYNDNSQRDIANNAITFNSACYQLMPTSMKNAANNSLPILLNHLEIAVDNRIYVQIKNDKIYSFDALIEEGKNYLNENFYHAIFVPFGESDKVLSYFLSAYIEARFGVDELNKINKFLAENEGALYFDTVIEFEELKNLKIVLDELKNLKEEKLFPADWEHYVFNDLSVLMSAKKIAFCFMDLYTHRQFDYMTIKNYTDFFFPIGRKEGYPTSSRSLIVPAVVATNFLTMNREISLECKKIVESFVNSENQRVLTRKSGLAPVNSSSDTQDSQAYDVRLWAASADSLAMDMGGAFLDPKNRKDFFESIRRYL